jgi:hypothetical protein
MQLSKHRVPAFALLELASAVSLTSADTGVSNLAAQTLRLIAIAERQPDVPINPALTEEERVSRHAVYEKIGAPRTVITGQCYHSVLITSESLPFGCRPSGVAEASPALVSVLGNSACYLRCHLGRVLLSVVRSNGAGHQRAI